MGEEIQARHVALARHKYSKIHSHDKGRVIDL